MNTSDESVGIFNINLEMTEEAQLLQEIYVYDIFVQEDGTRYVIYDPETKNLFFANIDSSFSTKISLPKELSGTLSHIYDWNSERLIIDAYGSHCIEILPGSSPKLIGIEKIKSDYFPFYQFLQRIYENEHYKYQIQFHTGSFIEISNHIATFYSLLNQEAVSVVIENTKYHDLIYKNGFFVFISEQCITIKTSTQSIVLKTDHEKDYFLRAALIESKKQLFLFILVGNKSNQFMNRVVKYELEAAV